MKKYLKENENAILDIVEEFEAETESVLREVRNCVRRGGLKETSKEMAIYLRSIAHNIERTADGIENFPKTDLDESENSEIIELKIGDIVDIKEYEKYDGKAKVTEIGKIRGGYFHGRPYVEAYESWGKDHAAFSTTGHNFCFMRSSRGTWEDLDNDTLLDSKYWPYLDNLFGYKRIKEAAMKEDNSRIDTDFYNFLSETFDLYDGSYHSLVQDVRSIEKDWVEGEENERIIRSTGETWLRQKGRELCADELLDE